MVPQLTDLKNKLELYNQSSNSHTNINAHPQYISLLKSRMENTRETHDSQKNEYNEPANELINEYEDETCLLIHFNTLSILRNNHHIILKGDNYKTSSNFQ